MMDWLNACHIDTPVVCNESTETQWHWLGGLYFNVYVALHLLLLLVDIRCLMVVSDCFLFFCTKG